MSAEHCLNCGAALSGPYCAQCGQKHIPLARWSLTHLSADLFEQITDLDNRAFRTLRQTLLQPGLVAQRYNSGQRARYTSPVKLLLVAFFIFFFYPILTDFALPLQDLLHYGWFTGPAEQWLTTLSSERAWTTTQLHEAFAEQQQSLVSSMVFLHIPLFALALWLLHFRRASTYVEHLVVAAYFMLFLMEYLLLAMVLFIIPVNLIAGWISWTPSEPALEVLRWVFLRLPFIVGLTLLLRQAYQQRWLLVFFKLMAALPAFMAAHMLYRTIMLYTTLIFL